jgi:hypothetical protein
VMTVPEFELRISVIASRKAAKQSSGAAGLSSVSGLLRRPSAFSQ